MGLGSLPKPAETARELTPAGLVCALPLEADAVAGQKLEPGRPLDLDRGLRVILGGMGYEAAFSAARTLAESGVGILISFGVAGGLAKGLNSGDLVVVTAVVDPGGDELAADARFSGHLAHNLANCLTLSRGKLAHAVDPVTTVADKQRLFEQTGSLAVDMETLAIAAFAVAAGMPWCSLRAIVDPAESPLPEDSLSLYDPSGRFEPYKLVRRLVRRPGLLSDLILLGARAQKAKRSLRLAAASLPAALDGAGAHA